MQGQHAWFRRAHPVKDLDPSVYDRYRNEVYRIYGVLEKQLEKHEWVAIDRFTVAGMSSKYFYFPLYAQVWRVSAPLKIWQTIPVSFFLLRKLYLFARYSADLTKGS